MEFHQPTSHADVNALLNDLLSRLRGVLGTKLVGLYLYGSVVTGDFDLTVSDIDLLAALSSDLTVREFDALEQMHAAFVQRYPNWQNRIEVAYVSVHALATFRTQTSTIAVISPGEPFHAIQAGKDWLMNWYTVREKGISLFGTPQQQIIDPISPVEFVQCIRQHLLDWHSWSDHMRTRSAQAYAILTMCRGLYTIRHGKQVSKLRSAAWAQQELPIWADLITNALWWRQSWRDQDIDHEATFPVTQRFVRHIIDLVSNDRADNGAAST